MSDKGRTDSAILASLKLEETRTSVTLRAAQEHKEGIMPHESMQEDRNIVIESCCLVRGNIFGKNVVLHDSDIRSVDENSDENLPGTHIQGGINAFEDVSIGVGSVVGSMDSPGGILAGGDVEIKAAIPLIEGGPSRVIIIGSVSGENITIGDGVVILGAVIGQTSVNLGNGVTIRDHVFTPDLTAGDGNLFGGLVVGERITMGHHNTVASGRIIIPNDASKNNIKGPIRSPYPGCNNCPKSDSLGGSDDVEDLARRLSCNFFKNITRSGDGLKVSKGTCEHWDSFEIVNPEKQFQILDDEVSEDLWDVRCVTNYPVESLNLEYDEHQIGIWEMTAESLGGI